MKNLIVTTSLIAFAFTSFAQKKSNPKRLNFFISANTKDVDIAMLGSQLQAKFKSLFHRDFYCIVVRSPQEMVAKITRVLDRKKAMIGSIWFDSHGFFSRRHASFQIGETEFSYATMKDSLQAATFQQIAAYADSNTRIGIGSCYGGASYMLPAVENFEASRMNGDSLMIAVGKLLNGALIYGCESFVMSVPGIFGNNYKLAGGPPNKHFLDPVYKPVWENLGSWNCYNSRIDSFYRVNTICLDGKGNINKKEQTYFSFTINRKKQLEKLANLKMGNYDIAAFYQQEERY